MKNNILLIGAGQLGSRHLQGLLRYNKPQKIFVLDPSEESLEIATHRAREIDHQHKLSFITNWNELPYDFALVIIATNSNVRKQIIEQLTENHSVRYLILEKVLFQDLDSYKQVHEILLKLHIQAWVNHPRRMFSSYKKLKSKLSNGPIGMFQYTGGNWGLGCNALHFIDLFVFLSGQRLLDLDVEWVDSQIQESKRKGYIEFTGTIKGLLENKSMFTITSLKGDASAGTLSIFDTNKRYIIQEAGNPQILNLNKDQQFEINSSLFEMEYQSTLTTKIISELLENGICNLPTYQEARHSHEIFVEKLLDKYNKITGVKNHSLPIT